MTDEKAALAPRAEDTLIVREAQESPDVVQRQRSANRETIKQVTERLRDHRPRAVITLARGSSDHAATFARYLIETTAGVLTSSASPSVSSIYDSVPELAGTVVLAISQSGRSPDLLAAAQRASAAGAMVVAMVNDESSPLAAMADTFIPLRAGPERSVAATKSFIASLAAVLDLLAAWTGDGEIESALSLLPSALQQAWALDWSAAAPELTRGSPMYVIGRGHGLGIAQEAALKLKETCGIQAEAFSSAEVRHGPLAVVQSDFPVFLFGQRDESLDGVTALATELADRGARVMSSGLRGVRGIELPTISADPVTAPILQILSFYRLVARVAVERGMDPDRPHHLSKITETL